MKLSETTVGELYRTFDDREFKELENYLTKLYSSKRNRLIELHLLFGECRKNKTLDQVESKELEKQFLQKSASNYSLFMTYVNKLHRIIKEFVILSKIEEKNLYTEVLWSEYLIENNLKRNLVINQSNYKLDLYGDPYPVQKEYFHARENFFLTFVKSNKRTKEEITANTLRMMDEFDSYYQFQMIDNFKTLCGFSDWYILKKQDKLEERLEDLLAKGIQSNNQLVHYTALVLSIFVNSNEDSFNRLRDIFYEKSNVLSKELLTTISTSLINYTATQLVKSNMEIFSLEAYKILNTLFELNQLLPTPSQAHLRLGAFIIYELKHGSPEKAREILRKSIGSVSSQQRDSCEKLCLAKIEVAEKNYEQARIYIDQGNTHDSLHYYPLFKTMLLKILIYLKDELRFAMERENLYKFLHKNKSLGEKNVQSYLKFYKYVDYMNEAKFKTLSSYMREKLEKALSPESEQFHDKEWMRGRFEELVKKADKENG